MRCLVGAPRNLHTAAMWPKRVHSFPNPENQFKANSLQFRFEFKILGETHPQKHVVKSSCFRPPRHRTSDLSRSFLGTPGRIFVDFAAVLVWSFVDIGAVVQPITQ